MSETRKPISRRSARPIRFEPERSEWQPWLENLDDGVPKSSAVSDTQEPSPKEARTGLTGRATAGLLALSIIFGA
ncbi:MAG TPA: hypothetical protein DCR54_01245, partial [Chloroflexi bacterium]|nr:hypothetical protein [Chloroflexota bacterium]